MDVGCSEGRRRGRSSWRAVWSCTPGSLQAPPVFSLLPRGLSPLGVDGRGHPDLLLLRHLPGVPNSPGQLQQVPQQLLQVSGGGVWGWKGASLLCDRRRRGGCGPGRLQPGPALGPPFPVSGAGRGATPTPLPAACPRSRFLQPELGVGLLRCHPPSGTAGKTLAQTGPQRRNWGPIHSPDGRLRPH